MQDDFIVPSEVNLPQFFFIYFLFLKKAFNLNSKAIFIFKKLISVPLKSNSRGG